MPLPVEELQKLATRYKADSESVYNTWFIDNEARLKPSTVPSIFSAFYSERRVQAVWMDHHFLLLKHQRDQVPRYADSSRCEDE